MKKVFKRLKTRALECCPQKKGVCLKVFLISLIGIIETRLVHLKNPK